MSQALQKLGNGGALLRLALNSALIVLLAYVLSQILWTILAPAQGPEPARVPEQAAVKAGEADVGAADLSVLTEYDPFLDVSAEAETFDDDAYEAPETSLNLTLKGVRANEESGGVAFILLPDNRQIRAGIGTEILDDVVVEYVFEDRITLNRQGELETLFLREGGGDGPSAIEAVSRSQPADTEKNTGRTSQPDVSDRANPAAPPVTARSGGEVSAATLLEEVSFTIVREQGVRNGFLLSAKTGTQTLAAAGFQSGDIIRAVNATPASQIDGESLYDLILQSANADFDVERAGERVRISVRFSEGVVQ